MGTVETSPSPIRVLCVEDNQLVADAIARKIEGDQRFEWLGWVDSAQALSDAAAKNSPHVVCMDLDIPGEDTFAMVRWLAENHPSVRVLMLTGHVRPELIDRALSAGAWGYLSKGEESRVIVDGIYQVAAGEFVLGTIARDGFHGPVPPRPITPSSDQACGPKPDREGWNAIRTLRRMIERISTPG